MSSSESKQVGAQKPDIAELRKRLRAKTGQQKEQRSSGWDRKSAAVALDREWEEKNRKLFSNMSLDSIDMCIENMQAKDVRYANRLRELKAERVAELTAAQTKS